MRARASFGEVRGRVGKGSLGFVLPPRFAAGGGAIDR
jgi:hypothetical protein